MTKATTAFALLESTDSLIARYLSWPQAQEHQGLIDELWASIAPHDPHQYRGISCILRGIPPPPSSWDEAEWLEALKEDPQDDREDER